MDLLASSPSATWWRLLQRQRGEGGRCAGASTAGQSGLAATWKVSWFVLGRWSAAGRLGASPRRRRPESPDLEEEGKLGAGPRPACHSGMWALRCFLWWFTKPILAMELLLLRVCWCLLLPLAVLVAGDERRVWLVLQSFSKDLVVILSFFGGFSAICSDLRVLLGLSVCVRVLYSGRI